MPTLILALDQGTTSSRAILFDKSGAIIGQHQIEFEQHFPHQAWVEHNPEDLWQTSLQCCQEVVKQYASWEEVAAMGISNQRETTLVWNRLTGKPIYPAIVWQDRRTEPQCRALREAGFEKAVKQKTGLEIDPYFSATKISWILDNVTSARRLAEQGELAFGTIDSYLLWQLTNGVIHATDATNASRTALFNIHRQEWDEDLLRFFNIPDSLLPEVKDSSGLFGTTNANILGAEIPIQSMIGDQQAALVGQACFQPGMIKSTYGTGCFMVLNTGEKVITSKNRLLSTVAYRINNKVTYALEGSIFSAGSTIQWLRDGLKIIDDATKTGDIAASLNSNEGVYLVPAFTGLGAPHWDADARAAIFCLNRATNQAHLVRAALESVAYQTRDLLEAMKKDGATDILELRVDGGMIANQWLMQFIADMLNLSIRCAHIVETTALGAAYLAALGAGIFQSLDDISAQWQSGGKFEPTMSDTLREKYYADWQDAVSRVITKQV